MPPPSRGRGAPLSTWAFLPALAHCLLLSFTILLVLKLQGHSISWWFTFCPLWGFHAVMVHCTCSMPAPGTPHDHQWSPCHASFALPLILAFELLLCCYLVAIEDPHRPSPSPPISLVFVFIPLLILEFSVLIDNFRMCIVLMPGEDDSMSDEALWETLPHFSVAVSMVFFLAATIFTVLKLSVKDDAIVEGIDWWTLLVDVCIGEFFAFLLCFKWPNPHQPMLPVPSTPSSSLAPNAAPSESSPLLGHAQGQPGTAGGAGIAGTVGAHSNTGSSRAAEGSARAAAAVEASSASAVAALVAEASASASGLSPSAATQSAHLAGALGRQSAAAQAARAAAAALPAPEGQAAVGRSPRSAAGSSEEGELEFQCGAAELGGHFMKAGLVAFQVLLCMKLEGEPKWAGDMSLWLLFSPLLLVQLGALVSSLLLLLEGLSLRYSPSLASRLSPCIRDHDPFVFCTRGMRLVSWWQRADEVRDERRTGVSALLDAGYPAYEATPKEYVRKMRKGQLKQEVMRLESVMQEQSETVKAQRQELERLQQEKVLCRVCFEREISLVLMPCRHRVLCRLCAEKCTQCPICRCHISDMMAVFDV